MPKGSTKPWVLIKLPAPTSDVTHCTADQHNPGERIRPATSSCCIRSDKNSLLHSSGLCSYNWQGYSNLQQLFYTPRLTNSLSPMCFLEGIFHCLRLYHFKDMFCLFPGTWTYLGASTWNDFLYPSFALALTLLAWQGTQPKVHTYTQALLTPTEVKTHRDFHFKSQEHLAERKRTSIRAGQQKWRSAEINGKVVATLEFSHD